MDKTLRNFFIALLFLAFSGPLRVQASHDMGGGITYQAIALGTYKVNYILYNDCSANPAPATQTLVLKSPGCNAGRSVTMNKVGQPWIGNPYCSSVPKLCSPSSGFFNHIATTYEATVTFSAAEQTCPDWILSVEAGSRPEVENLQSATSYNLFTEAFLRINVNLGSPEFGPLSPHVNLVCVGQETRLSFQAAQGDCDSLSYELVQALGTGGTPIPYKQNPVAVTGVFTNPKPQLPYCNTCTPPNPQTGTVATGMNAFSAVFPLPAYNANWASGTQTVGTVPYFQFNPHCGELRFKPQVYYPNTPASQGRNRYSVAVKVNQWRKINGILTKIGSIRREVLFLVEDCGTNQTPAISNLRANGQPIQSGDIITVRPMSNLQLDCNVTDPETGTLQVYYQTAPLWASHLYNTNNNPNYSLTFDPMMLNTAMACELQYITMEVSDNNCPVKGTTTAVVGIRISNQGTPTGIKAGATDLQFSVFPNPFRSELTFRFNLLQKAESLVICNLLGQEVDRIPLKNYAPGKQEVRWGNAGQCAAGTYVARLITEDHSVETVKFTKLP